MDPLAELSCRSLREGEGEDAVGGDLVLGHAVAVALHEDTGLPGPSPRLGEDVTLPRRDRGPLRLGPLRSEASRLGCGLRRDEGELFGGAHGQPWPWLSPPAACSSGAVARSSRQIGW